MREQPTHELEEMLRRLPREIRPPADLWPEVVARLHADRSVSLTALTDTLDREKSPPEALWKAIEARLEPVATRQRPDSARRVVPWHRFAAAAALAAVVVGALIAARDSSRVAHPVAPPAIQAPGATNAALAEGATPRGFAAGAWWMLRMPKVSGDVAEQIRRDFRLVQAQRQSIEAALAKDPADDNLRELWMHTYTTEMNLVDAYGRTIMAYSQADARD